MANLVVGTRGSRLALCQTESVIQSLRRAHPDLDIETRIIQTRGDQTQAAGVPLSSFGEKGIFAKELEAALLEGWIDLAVHSMKDLAPALPPGLAIGAVPVREDPRDVLVGSALEALPSGARIGTGSVRRRALLLSRRPDLRLLEIRGNVDSRLRKLGEGRYEALCLAAAGLNRLGLQEQVAEVLDPGWFVPDPGQGALALQIRDEDRRLHGLVQEINHAPSADAAAAERAFLRSVGGSCRTPVGALAVRDVPDGTLTLAALVAAPDGTALLRARATGDDPDRLGREIAEQLRAAGADRLLLPPS